MDDNGGLTTILHPFAAARRSPWAVWLLACGVYVMSVMHRMALGVSGPLATERLGISAAQLGSFVTLQLGLYAAMQVPWGLAIDRWGPRRILLAATTILGIAEITFAFAGSYPVALAARAMLGVGDSAVFIAVIRLVTLWFAPRRFAMMAMITGLFSMAGSLLATIPLALAFSTWGWTRTLGVAGAISLGYAVLLLRPALAAPYRASARRPVSPTAATPRSVSSRSRWRPLVADVRRTWRIPEIRLAFWTHAATMATGTAFTALWAFPYLTNGLGLPQTQAASVLTFFVLGMLGASLLLGPITSRRRGSRAPLALASAVAGVLAWVVLLGWPGGQVPFGVVVAVTLVLAVGGPASQVGFQIARDHCDPTRHALATGMVNVAGFTTAMLGTVLVGVVVDLRSGGTEPTLLDYRWGLAVLGVAALLTTTQMLRWLLLCRRRTLRLVAEGAQPPVVPVAHWWDSSYERAAALRRGRRDHAAGTMPRLASVMQTIDLRGTSLSPAQLRARLPRAEVDIELATERVAPILAAVRSDGGGALRRYAEEFDGGAPASLRVPRELLAGAPERLDPGVRDALVEAIRRTRLGHEAQLPTEVTTELAEGALVHQRWVPVRRVGLYVPGGLAPLASSVVMNVVAAQVAGVPSLAVASPPQKDNDGWPATTILAACELLGVDEVYAAGGAQAIGMFAYGVGGDDEANRCEAVDVVTGPGNIYVAAAKRAVLGVVGIDSEAGTTEIAVLADASADPEYVAADLISQAEHDPAAGSVLVTDSTELASAVLLEIERQVDEAKHSERIRAALSGPQSAVVLVDDLDQGIQVVDAYAAEHLEVQTADAPAVAARVTNAGAIFVGPYSPVPLGDYIAGSNHVLPTGGTARYAAGLNVHAYLRSVQVIEYTAAALEAVTDPLVALAEAEDLPAHGTAATLRRGRPEV